MSAEIFRLEGEFWTVTFEGLTIRVRDAKGMRYLAYLLARPNESIAVDTLFTAVLGYGPGNHRADGEAPAAPSPADRERLRSAVAKRVRAAIARLAEYNPALGHFLTATVHTGYACSHHPDPGRLVHWDCSPYERRGGEPPSPLSRLQPRRTSMAISRSSVRLAVALMGLLLPVPALADFGAVVATGETHSCATTLARTVKCWGDNSMGQLGNDFLPYSRTPVEVSGLQNVYALAVGAAHTCATDGAGQLWCWGMNNAGQIGDGTTTNRSTPVQVVLPGYVYDVAAGDFHTCAAAGGNVFCWGYNGYGAVGDGTTTNRTSPVLVTGGSSSVTAGTYHTCATGLFGTQCWGMNNHGQLGDGTTTGRLSPVSVNGIGSSSRLVAGGYHTCASSSAPGVLKCWGRNVDGELGDGTFTDRLTPVSVVGITDGFDLALGHYHTCSRALGGIAKCWGLNGSGQVGDGTTTSRETPVEVLGLTAYYYTIAAGGLTSCAVIPYSGANLAGAVRCWGHNLSGQIGDGTTTSRTAPVSTQGFDDRCIEPERTTLVLRKVDTGPGDDVLVWKGEVQLPFPYDPPLDPVANGAHVLMYELDGSFPNEQRVIDDVTIPPGEYLSYLKKGWKANATGTVWTYVNQLNDLPSRINSVKITTSSRAPGLVKYMVKGKAGSFPLQGPGSTHAIVVLFSLETPSSAAGQCAVTRLAVVPSGYHCFFNAPGSTLTCR